MRRKITDKLIEWKNKDKGKTALLLEGARRVGKSYIIEDFAKKNYKSYILIDFFSTRNEIKQLFEDYLDDLDTFFSRLSLFTNTRLYERESIIVFDEVQLFPRARAALKYLVADGRYDYIETGSLLSIKRNVENILIPSEEYHLNMYPMDFEEFLWAKNDFITMDFIKDCYKNRLPLGQNEHRTVMNKFREYLLVGGMPQVVKAFIETNDFSEAERAKQMILSLYRDDISKYAEGYKEKTRAIYDEIPASLQRHEISFNLAAIDKNARFRDYENAFFWLKDAMTVNICYAATEPNIGLNISRDRMRLKPYMADTGLLVSMIFDENGLADRKIYEKILIDKLEVNLGMVIENIVAQMLVATGRKLYYFASSSQTNNEDRMEVDFLIRKKEISNKHNIVPIEVKSTTRYRTASLNKFIRKYKEYVSDPIILHTGDYMVRDGIECFPLYMAYLF